MEHRTVEHIPVTERNGRTRDLFTVWFGSGLTLSAAATGFLSTVTYGLPIWAASLSLLAGCLIGGVLLALHAAQGPQTGVPQMLQTRAQFGSYGSLLVVALVVLIYTGFVATNIALGVDSLGSLIGFDGIGATMLLGAIPAAFAIFGYRAIHRLAGIVSIVAGAALAVVFLWILGINGLPPGTWAKGSCSIVGIMGSICLGTLWLMSGAPAVSDYTRYMPIDTGTQGAFWGTYAGAVLGNMIPIFLGILLGASLPNLTVVQGLTALAGKISTIALVILSVSLVAQSSLLLYSGALSILTVGQTMFENWLPGPQARAFGVSAMAAATILLAWQSSGHFFAYYSVFLTLILCTLIPWTSINLIDYYFIRCGRYDIDSLFRADGGIYGKLNKSAVFCYIFGVLIQLPFLSTAVYVAPIAKRLNGIDISWAVGLIVVCPIYYFMVRSKRRDPEYAYHLSA